MTQETERGINEFEAWARSNGLDWDLTFCQHGGYVDEGTGMAYLAWQARARVGKGEVERRKAIAGLHGCRLAARGEYCASCVIQATNYEYQGEEDRRSKPHDYTLSAKPVEVGELAGLIASVYNRPNYAQDTDGCTELAQAILNKYNVTEK